MERMKILAIFDDEYGKRIADFIEKDGKFEVEKLEYKLSPPQIIDDPADFLPALPSADLLLFLAQDSGVIQLMPDMAKRAGVRSVIVAVDQSGWLPPGLQLQIENSLTKEDILYIFARPFCSLEKVGDKWIDEFALHYGLPGVEIEVEEGKIGEVTVLRSAPCGSTFFVAENLIGVVREDAVEKAGLLFHNYPCMASMEHDRIVGDTLMHIAGYKIKNAVREALEKTK